MKSKTTAMILSGLLGGWGIDRFYLGYTGLGILKLLTGGGFGIWYIIDLIMICTGSLGPANGQPYQEDMQLMNRMGMNGMNNGYNMPPYQQQIPYQQPGYGPNGAYPNGGYPNAGYPNNGYPNAGYPNNGYPNAGYPNAGYPNGGYPNASYPNAGQPQPIGSLPIASDATRAIPQQQNALPDASGQQPTYYDPNTGAPVYTNGPSSVYAELDRITQLHSQGMISDSEFDRIKSSLLAKL